MSRFVLPPITADSAQREPLAQRLDFTRPVPSWAMRAALAHADAPPLPAGDLLLLKTRQRPRRAS